MYNASNDYFVATKKTARASKLRGTVGGVSFYGKDTVKDSFAVRNQLCPATAIELGGVYIGECDLTFSTQFANSMSIRGSWRGVEIVPEIGIELGDSSFEYIPLGIFTVEDAKWVDAGLQIVAYDNMARLDKPLNITNSIGSLYALINWACLDAGVTFGMSAEDMAALPNGNEQFYFARTSTIETDRDLVSACAVACGCYATIDRSGRLVLRPLPSPNDIAVLIPSSLRYSTSFSDFTSYYSELAVTNEGDSSVDYYMNSNLGGLTLDIGSNPLLQAELDTTRDRQRQAIADAIQPFRAVPFSVSLLPNPAFDLGDVVRFTGGIGNDSIGVVMSLVHKVNSTTIEGYGENPAAANATSALSKQVASNARKESENGLSYYTFTNAEEITINSEEQTTLIDVEFAVNSTTTVMMFHELKMLNHLVDDTQTVTLYFYHGDDLIAYQPMDTYSEDETYHFFPSFYPLLDVMNGMTQRWRVKAQTSSGTATIAVDDVKATLVGQKMIASDEWLGTIKVEDEYTPIMAGALVGEWEDEATLETGTPVGYFRTTLDGSTRTTLDGNARTYIP